MPWKVLTNLLSIPAQRGFFMLGVIFGTSGLLLQPGHASVFGIWAPENKEDRHVQVRLFPCQDQVCGEIIRLGAQEQTSVCHILDVHNPEADERTRRVLGLQIVKGFRQAHPTLPADQETRWVGGFIYNPDNGDTLGDWIFRYQIELSTPDTLVIGLQDCWLSCRGNRTWRRVHRPGPSQTCPGP